MESSQIRSPEALERLCFVFAIAALFLVSQGVDVIQNQRWRLVDVHWFRGGSYCNIGWKWVHRALVKGYSLISKLTLPSFPAHEPPVASREQAEKRAALTFSVHFEIFKSYIVQPT